MRLVIDKCSHCSSCIEVCPNKANSECNHCLDPECVKACPKKAFYEVSPGIWAVDASKCDGCGLCALACPYNAIYVDGYARKCDLCGGEPKCVQVCPCGLHLEETEEEIEAKKRVLGWEKTSGEYESGVVMPSYQEAMLCNTVIKLFRELAKETDASLEETLDEYCEEENIVLEKDQRERILQLMSREVYGFSVLDPLLADDSLEEITVNGNEPIRVYRRGTGWLETDLAFNSTKKVIDIINRIARPLGRRITLQKPRLNACLPNGSRLHAAIPPITGAPCLTIRKFRENPMTPRELINNKTISPDALAFLWMAMQCDLNIIVAGSTGSGKTTTLNCLSAFIPLHERIIIVEETPEISIPHKHTVRLTVNSELDLSMNELVNDTLRMRPDRVVVGEVRTEQEAKALMNTMLAGQGKGSIATFHALNSREAVNRLRNLGISEQDLSALDLIVVQKRWDKYEHGQQRELRRVIEISEIDIQNGKAVPKKLFNYDAKNDVLRRVASGRTTRKIAEVFSLHEKKIVSEIKQRASFLSNSAGDFAESVAEVAAYALKP